MTLLLVVVVIQITACDGNKYPPYLSGANPQTYNVNEPITPLALINQAGDSLISCTADTFPVGLQVAVSADKTTCEISGTPTQEQEATTHTITATNPSGTSSATISITVNPAKLLPPKLTNTDPQNYMINEAISTLSFVNTGGGSLTNCSADTLPAGLQVTVSADSTTCEISGTPTSQQSETIHTVTATNNSGSSDAIISITVTVPEIPFITRWKTDNPGTTNDNQIMISTQNSGYDYHIDWGDGSSDENVKGNITHTYPSAGTYTIKITGDFPQIYFNATGNDPEKLLSVEQWGNNQWRSMKQAFAGCKNVVINATDTPDLSLVTDMSLMFNGASAFNQEIGNWDVSNVTNMKAMFSGASAFNQDISNWNVSNVTNMSYMFSGHKYTNELSITNTEMKSLFLGEFDQDIGRWDVSKVTDMSGMFSGSQLFNQDISHWDVSSVTNMSGMFASTFAFNQPIGQWNVSSVTDMSAMFIYAYNFNHPIGNWDVSSVTNMSKMFKENKRFNQPIGNWNMSKVTDISYMFKSSRGFSQNINSWNVSAVTNMEELFRDTYYNHPLNNWDVSKVTNMKRMFYRTNKFNQPLDKWDVSSVTNMNSMFAYARGFNQPLGDWNVSSVTDMTGMFGAPTTLSTANYDHLLLGWSKQNVQKNISIDVQRSQYSPSSQAARDILTNTFNWTIRDSGVVPTKEK